MSLYNNRSQLKIENGKPVAFSCSGEEEEENQNSSFLKLPIGLTLEAQAFGAEVRMDSKGLRQASYPYETLDEFLMIKMPDYNSGIAGQLFESISSSEGEPVMLKLTGAFSVLASLIEPMVLYKGTKKNPEGIHMALRMVNSWLVGYAKEGLKRGVKVISFADPMGFQQVIGDSGFKEFAGFYQRELLLNLQRDLKNAVIHICGRNSIDLEQCGFIRSEKQVCMEKNYGSELLVRAEEPEFYYCGHGCIIEEGEYQPWIWKLTLL